MTKRLLSVWILICAAVLLVPSAFAAGQSDGEKTAATIQISDANFLNQTCSFQIRLSDPEQKGCIFIAVYDAQSGKMKYIEEHTAKETITVTLEHVLDTDHVKAMWTDAHYMPIAQSEFSGSPDTDATTYDNYEDYSKAVLDMLQDYKNFSTENTEAMAQSGSNEYAFARLIVRSEDELPDLTDYHVARRISDTDGHTVLQFTSAQDAKDCAEFLRKSIPSDGFNSYVTPDSTVRVSPKDPESVDNINAASLSWGVPMIHADSYAANLLKRGLNRNITVAVIDTGVDYTHEFLQNRTVSGRDFVGNDNDPMDEHYHGTHVAGTIVDCTPGLSNIKIMPVRVLDANGSGSFLNVSLGIRYAADNGADVINMSLGGGHSSVTDEAVEYAISKNVIVVVAAGNERDDANDHCPAHIQKCITVSAVDSKFKPASFTNYGNAVDLAAPGVDIKSCVPKNGYRSLNGTSMASPHVAACAAMLREEFSNLTPSQAEQKLVDAVQVPSGWNAKYGAGVVDMEPFISDPEPAEFYAILYEDGEMVFQNSATPDPGRTPLDDAFPISAVSAQYAGWYPLRDKITKVTFAEEVHPASTALWFYGFENLKTIQNPENLKTGGTTNMSQMFARCKALETLDLRNMDTGKVTNMQQMFFQCASLRTILASDSFTVSKVSESADMFTGCVSLKGENGTAYSSSHTDKIYARLDKGSSSPGYFSETIPDDDGPSETIYAVLYSNGELKFQNNPNAESGRAYTKIYTTDSGGYDKNIQSVWSAWYEERTQIRSVNFGAAVYPTSTALWFYGCNNLSSITNPGNLHTDYVTDMSQMFAYCSSLTALDLSGFKTEMLTNTATMFFNCGNLITIYASDLFTTDTITDSKSMFEGCTALKGGNGTVYSSDHVDKTYARIDSASTLGYFTAK